MKHKLVVLFVAFNVYATVVMALPSSWMGRDCLVSPIRVPLNALGVFHYLPLFSPPPTMEKHIEFIAQFDDGTSTNWRYPRRKVIFSDPLGTFQRYIQQFLWWHDEQHPKLYPAFAQFIARQVDSRNKHPLLVQFVASECPTIPFVNHKTEDLHRTIFYSYQVLPVDLQCQ